MQVEGEGPVESGVGGILFEMHQGGKPPSPAFDKLIFRIKCDL